MSKRGIRRYLATVIIVAVIAMMMKSIHVYASRGGGMPGGEFFLLPFVALLYAVGKQARETWAFISKEMFRKRG